MRNNSPSGDEFINIIINIITLDRYIQDYEIFSKDNELEYMDFLLFLGCLTNREAKEKTRFDQLSKVFSYLNINRKVLETYRVTSEEMNNFINNEHQSYFSNLLTKNGELVDIVDLNRRYFYKKINYNNEYIEMVAKDRPKRLLLS